MRTQVLTLVLSCTAAYDNGPNVTANHKKWPTPPAHGNGIRNISDPYWRATFTNIFSQPALQIPWHSVMGNHDWMTPANVSAQLDPALEPRWHGAMNEVRDFYASSGDLVPMLSLFLIETNPLITEYMADGSGQFNFSAGRVRDAARR